MLTRELELDRIRQAVSGSEAALTLLLTDSHARLCQHLARRIPASLAAVVDAEDIAQEAYTEAFRHIGTFQPRGDDAFYRWIGTIAIRRLRNAIKRQRAVKRGAGDGAVGRGRPNIEDSMIGLLDLVADPGHTPSRSAARHEAVAAVRAALAALPPDYRRAVWLVHIRGYSTADAAAEMGRTESAVQNLCYKAKQRLRALLGSPSNFRGLG